MVLVSPDILTDACSLSLGLMLLLVPVGLPLWLLGWRSHRFWVVMVTTVLAGVWGLHSAPAWQAPPLLTAVLLALAAGVLALALVRLVAFAAGGLCGMLLLEWAYPSLHQPIVVFLIAGLLCLVLFRPCMMALTSFAGALLLTWSALMLLNHNAVINAAAFSENSITLLNWTVLGLAGVGLVVQFLLDRYVFRKKAKAKSWVSDIWGMLTSRGSAPPKVIAIRRAA